MMSDIKQELAKRAENTKKEGKLTKSMSIADLIKAMEPEIKRALPEVITRSVLPGWRCRH